ncbi:MAG TPA: serine/threonine-protein kinase [Polyangiaceae bacterium]|nr:serine/threonine-protein kinase [Polyangiaceae bacterium]
MRACRVCGRLYPEDAGFCPVDGQGLYSATQVPIDGEDDAGRVGRVLLERYQVRRVVADGGMGRVYEALDLVDQRNVALKVLHAEVARDEVAVERFKREFEVSALLSSVHIIDVLDFKPTDDGTFALVMEFLYGEELRSTLRREGQLAPERLVRMLSQVALALDEAHAKKLVHRDLKPENLFLCQTSEGDMVKVLDFGSVRDNANNAKKLTVMGTTIGSPYYMPPEQAQGLDTLDARADVWALGAIGYECLTGQVPFKGVNGPSILLEILTREPVPPSQISNGATADIPPAVDTAILRALKKTVGLRTANAGQLADELGRAYGLQGDHRAWAGTTERELGVQIASRIRSLLDDTTAVRSRASVTDAFFGDREGLGFSLPPSGPPSPARIHSNFPSGGPTGPSGAERGGDAPPSSLSVPMLKRASWIAPTVVAVTALLAGVVLALLFV